MRIYVSAKTEERALAAAAAVALETLGHTITFKWWEAEGNIRGWSGQLRGAVLNTARARIAATEVAAVYHADAVVQIGVGGRGAAAELGVCLGLGKRAALVLPENEIVSAGSIFWYHPLVTVAESPSDWSEASIAAACAGAVELLLSNDKLRSFTLLTDFA